MQAMGWLSVGLTYLVMVLNHVQRSLGGDSNCPDWPFCDLHLIFSTQDLSPLGWARRGMDAGVSMIVGVLLVKILGPSLFKSFKSETSKASASPTKVDSTAAAAVTGEGQTSKVLPRVRWSSFSPSENQKNAAKSVVGILILHFFIGGLVVVIGSTPLLSTLYFLTTPLVLGALIALACTLTWVDPVVSDTPAKIKKLSLAGVLGLFFQFFLGAWVKRTNSGMACPSFPNCLDQFFPDPRTLEAVLAFSHRWWGVLMVGVFFHILIAARQTSPSFVRSARSAFLLTLAQILLGIGAIKSGLRVDSKITHAWAGYLLWGVAFYLAVRAGSLKWLWQTKIRFAVIKELAKSGIVTLVLISVLAGYIIGQSHETPLNWKRLALTLLGILFLASGSSALNQYQERHIDAQMPRTAGRPLPSGRMSPSQVIAFVALSLILGISLLLYLSPSLFILGVIAVISYNGLYTLWWKKRWAYAAVPGAIPGALPILMGYVATTGKVFAPAGLYLFFILFFWQMPHFWALALRYQKDYAQGGFPTLPVKHGEWVTLNQIIVWSLSYFGLAFIAPLFLSVGLIYWIPTFLISLKVGLELYRFVKNPEGPRWLHFFLWVNFSLIVYLAAAAVDLWIIHLPIPGFTR